MTANNEDKILIQQTRSVIPPVLYVYWKFGDDVYHFPYQVVNMNGLESEWSKDERTRNVEKHIGDLNRIWAKKRIEKLIQHTYPDISEMSYAQQLGLVLLSEYISGEAKWWAPNWDEWKRNYDKR